MIHSKYLKISEFFEIKDCIKIARGGEGQQHSNLIQYFLNHRKWNADWSGGSIDEPVKQNLLMNLVIQTARAGREKEEEKYQHYALALQWFK